MTALVLALALALLARTAGGEEVDAISPDRAGASTGTAVVGPGVVQLETGVNYGHERMAGARTDRRFGLEAAVRVGLTERLEVGVIGEPLVRLRGEIDATGHGDVTLNAKYRFLDPPTGSPWPSLGLLPFVTLPVTEEPLGSGKTDIGVLLLASFDLPWRLALDADAGLAARGQSRPAGHLLQAFVAAGLSRDVSERVTLFTELVYTTPEERDGRHALVADAGVIWRPTRDVALDASVLTSAAGAAPDWTVRAGLSVRLGH